MHSFLKMSSVCKSYSNKLSILCRLLFLLSFIGLCTSYECPGIRPYVCDAGLLIVHGGSSLGDESATLLLEDASTGIRKRCYDLNTEYKSKPHS